MLTHSLGPIGQCMVRWAILKGAKKVYAIDSVPARLELAKAAGAQVISVNFKEVDVSKHVHELEPDGLDGMSYLSPPSLSPSPYFGIVDVMY